MGSATNRTLVLRSSTASEAALREAVAEVSGATDDHVFKDLPQIYPSRLVSKRNLKAHTICPINDGLDGRFHDSASAQFNEHAVSDFVFGHGCGILYHAASSELFPKENISGNASVSRKTVHGFGKPEQ
jgi:hypothetical protein